MMRVVAASASLSTVSSPADSESRRADVMLLDPDRWRQAAVRIQRQSSTVGHSRADIKGIGATAGLAVAFNEAVKRRKHRTCQ